MEWDWAAFVVTNFVVAPYALMTALVLATAPGSWLHVFADNVRHEIRPFVLPMLSWVIGFHWIESSWLWRLSQVALFGLYVWLWATDIEDGLWAGRWRRLLAWWRSRRRA